MATSICPNAKFLFLTNVSKFSTYMLRKCMYVHIRVRKYVNLHIAFNLGVRIWIKLIQVCVNALIQIPIWIK